MVYATEEVDAHFASNVVAALGYPSLSCVLSLTPSRSAGCRIPFPPSSCHLAPDLFVAATLVPYPIAQAHAYATPACLPALPMYLPSPTLVCAHVCMHASVIVRVCVCLSVCAYVHVCTDACCT
jgi:hypothetical protein